MPVDSTPLSGKVSSPSLSVNANNRLLFDLIYYWKKINEIYLCNFRNHIFIFFIFNFLYCRKK